MNLKESSIKKVRSEEELIQKDENSRKKEKKVPRNPPIHESIFFRERRDQEAGWWNVISSIFPVCPGREISQCPALCSALLGARPHLSRPGPLGRELKLKRGQCCPGLTVVSHSTLLRLGARTAPA